ncbi:hypothetical protein D6D13_06040 [Aureobasidium pullulans]|uniref:Uncharacterized protein n=1 Tax=Aureobasidium pullulans TaxID=5580 RepID=A0A4S9CQE5_AURPU|nr:hypothetical protein D6D13_06040 [Aureobasidium pullulans]
MTNDNMSSSRPRPSMHADLYYTWLWCDDNAKVNQWFMNVRNRQPYRVFYASFINAANKAWVVSTDPNGKLKPIESRMVDCLLQEPIPAEQLIDMLERYNKFIGGNKGNLKRKGLIKWDEEEPDILAIEAGVKELYNMVEKFYLRSCVTKAKAKANKSKATSSDTNNNDKVGDEEMEDVNDSSSQQPLASLQDVSEELTAAASTANSYKDMSKTNNSVKYGELAVIGKKKKEEDDEDMNIN